MPGIILAPVHWLGGDPLTIYNVLILASFVLNAAAATYLGRKLTGRLEAGIIAGLIFGFAPHRFEHFEHLELQLTWWIPLIVVSLEHALTTGGSRSWATLSVLFTFQTLSCIYHTLFLVVSMTAIVPMIMITNIGRINVKMVGTMWLLVPICVGLLYSAPYRGSRHEVGDRDRAEVNAYSAVPANFLAAHPNNVTYGKWTSHLGQGERYLFPGIIASGLALIGLWSPRRKAVVIWLIVLGVSVELCLGMNGSLYPFLYDHIDVFKALRVPARAAILLVLGIAALACLGVELIMAAIRRPVHRYILFIFLAATFSVEVRPQLPLRSISGPPSAYRLFRNLPQAVLLEMPVATTDRLDANRDAFYMYYSTSHWRPLLNGYSGFYPQSYIELLERLKTFPDRTSLQYVRARGVTHLVLHRAEWSARLDFDSTIVELSNLGLPLIFRFRDVSPNDEVAIFEVNR